MAFTTTGGGWVYRTASTQYDANVAVINQCQAWNQGCTVTIQFCDHLNEQQVKLDQRQYDEFAQNWRSCMTNQMESCESALQYPKLTDRNRTVLLDREETIRDSEKRKQEFEAQQQAAAAEAQEADRQRLADEQAENEAKAKQLSDQAAELQRTKEPGQRAAAEIKHKSDIAALFTACWNGDLVSCDAAEQLPLSPQ